MQLAASNMKVSISRLMADPEFYIFNYAEKTQNSEFLIINQELLEKAPFIDSRLERFARGQFTVATTKLNELVEHLPGPRPSRHYIFHHAFVCSTLLARCLAQADAFFSLKEPHIVRRLADMQRALARNPKLMNTRNWKRLLDTHLQLLAKNYDHGDKVIIKASNVAINLLPEILNHTAQGNCLYLYSTLPQFLVSNLKKLEETQKKIPDLLVIFGQDSDFFQRYPGFADIHGISFLQKCALLWLLCNYNMLSKPESMNSSRFRTLAMDDFLATPREVLLSVCRFFDHQPNVCELGRMSGNVMATHAKDPNQPYNVKIRAEENRKILLRYGQEIDQAVDWLAPLIDALEIYPRLASIKV